MGQGDAGLNDGLVLEGKFLDAATLKLTEQERCALIKTLAWLEAGKLDHENEMTAGFNMGNWGGRCGSVCCIGGSAEVLGHVQFTPWPTLSHKNPQLYRLFYPGAAHASMSKSSYSPNPYKATTAQAAVALKHYLETGKENWAMAMKTPKRRN